MKIASRPALALILSACIYVTACAEGTQEDRSAVDASDWRPTCLGYLAMNLPPSVQPADHRGFLATGYRFPSSLFQESPDTGPPSTIAGHVMVDQVEIGESSSSDFGSFNEGFLVPASKRTHARVLRSEYIDLSRSEDDYAKDVQELKVAVPNNIAWRIGGRFEFITWLAQEQRRLVFLGKMSENPDRDKGSAALAKRMIEALWSRYHIRKRDEVPSAKGLCTPHGFVADLHDKVREPFNAYLPYRSEAQPALIYTISMAPGLSSQERLEDQPQPWRETPQEVKQRQEQSKRKGEWLSIGPGALVEKYLEPEYLTVAGQRARLSGVKFRPSMDQYDYEVQIETLGDPSDPKKPRIIVMAQGLKAKYYTGLQGQPPAPPLEQVLPTLKAIAQSMRVR